jgi:hypothetical protein
VEEIKRKVQPVRMMKKNDHNQEGETSIIVVEKRSREKGVRRPPKKMILSILLPLGPGATSSESDRRRSRMIYVHSQYVWHQE